MDTGVIVLLVFVVGLLLFLLSVWRQDHKAYEGSTRTPLDNLLDLLFLAWIFNHDHKE